MTDEPSNLDPEMLVRLGCIEGLNQGNPESTRQYYTEDAVYHTAGIENGGVDDIVAQAEMWRDGTSNFEADIIETVVDDDGDGVTFEYVVRGVHDGELADIPPTGNSFEAKGIGYAELEDGRIAEYTLVFDRLGLFRQLGVA